MMGGQVLEFRAFRNAQNSMHRGHHPFFFAACSLIYGFAGGRGLTLVD